MSSLSENKMQVHQVISLIEMALKRKVMDALSEMRLEVAETMYASLSEWAPEGQKKKTPGQNFAQKRKTLLHHIRKQNEKIRTLKGQRAAGTHNAATHAQIKAAMATREAHRAELNALQKRGY